MRKGRLFRRPKSDINITPFIDILLVLLVIFMTITPKVQVGLQTHVPQPPPPGPQPPQTDTAIVISMDGSGAIRINQKAVDLGSLSRDLLDIFKTRNDKTAFVQADSKLLFSQIAQLVDAAKAGGVERVGLMTEAIRSVR